MTMPATSNCPRCGDPLYAYAMSWFNTDEICLQCIRDEKHAPNYEKAREEERRHTERGLALQDAGDAAGAKAAFNFAGIGLAPEDEEELARRRELRVAAGSTLP